MQKTLFDEQEDHGLEFEPLTLRPYQKDAVGSICDQWDKGKWTLAALSTGTGKTIIFLAALARDLGPDDRALVIAHRQELIYQPRDRIFKFFPDLADVGIVMANEDRAGCKVVIATIQTLNANGRLDRIFSYGKITHVITDESHHSVAPSYLSVYERLKEHNPQIKHLGVTATPRRTDGDGLSQVYDSVAYRMGIKQSIKSGALCPFVALGFRLPVNISNVRRVGQGWDDEQLGDVLKARNAEELVIEKWIEHTENKPTICFTASVAQAHSLAQRFREAGYAFEAADGTTPKAERRAILARFKAGTTTGVVNCALWTEGFDAPQIESLVQVRPTKSDLVYMQMMGRALRVYPGKQVATILDFVPDGDRDILQAGDMLGKPKEQREAEEKATEDGVILGAFGINSKGEGVDGDPDEIVVEVLDYLTSSRLAWTFDGFVASATVGDKATLAITMPDDTAASRVAKADELRAEGRWSAAYNKEYKRLVTLTRFTLYQIHRNYAERLDSYDTWEDASEAAEDFCILNQIDVLGKRSAKWRKQSASEKQENLCRRLGVWEEGMSKGRAAQAITHFFARKALRL